MSFPSSATNVLHKSWRLFINCAFITINVRSTSASKFGVWIICQPDLKSSENLPRNIREKAHNLNFNPKTSLFFQSRPGKNWKSGMVRLNCAVPGCPSVKTDGMQMFHTPRDQDFSLRWKKLIGNVEPMNSWKTALLCENHFLDEDYTIVMKGTHQGRRKLVKGSSCV